MIAQHLSFQPLKELYMNKWIMPVACVFVLGACSSMGTDKMGSGSTSGSSSMGSGSSSMGSGSAPAASGAAAGAYKAPGTADLPGSRGTAGTPVDPSAPAGSGTGSSGVPAGTAK